MKLKEEMERLINKYGIDSVADALKEIRRDQAQHHKQQVVNYYRDGNTNYSYIALATGLSRNRVREIIMAEQRSEHRAKKPEDDIDTLGLSIRARNVLIRNDITKIPRLIELIRSGEVAPGRLRNFGVTAYNEIISSLKAHGIEDV